MLILNVWEYRSVRFFSEKHAFSCYKYTYIISVNYQSLNWYSVCVHICFSCLVFAVCFLIFTLEVEVIVRISCCVLCLYLRYFVYYQRYLGHGKKRNSLFSSVGLFHRRILKQVKKNRKQAETISSNLFTSMNLIVILFYSKTEWRILCYKTPILNSIRWEVLKNHRIVKDKS